VRVPSCSSRAIWPAPRAPGDRPASPISSRAALWLWLCSRAPRAITATVASGIADASGTASTRVSVAAAAGPVSIRSSPGGTGQHQGEPERCPQTARPMTQLASRCAAAPARRPPDRHQRTAPATARRPRYAVTATGTGRSSARHGGQQAEPASAARSARSRRPTCGQPGAHG
jgi:hypothetical protein